MFRIQSWAAAFVACAAVLAACGGDEQAQQAAPEPAQQEQQAQPQPQEQQAQPAQQAEQVQQTRAEPEPVLLVVVSNGVIGDWTSQVAGDLAEVRVLTPPGADVHTLELSVEDVRAINAADLAVMNGAGLEAAWQSLVEENAERVLWLAEAVEEAGLELAPFGGGMTHEDEEHDDHDEHGHEEEDGHDQDGEEHDDHEHEEDEDHADEDEHGHDQDEEEHDDHGHEEDEDHEDEHGHDQDEEEHHDDEEHDEHGHDQDEEEHHDDEEHDEHEHEENEDDGHGHHGHDHGSEDPHFWFDLELASASVRAIAAELTELRPDEADAIAERLEAYLGEMAEADREAAALLSDLTGAERLLVTFHDAFAYFARRYGLTVAGFVVEGPEQDVGAGQIAELIDLMNREGAVRIYREPQYESTLVEAIAGQTGAEIGVIYPQPAGEVRTWAELVLTNARAIAGR